MTEVTTAYPLALLVAQLSADLHVVRQDHNSFSYQASGFIHHVVNQRAEFIGVYLPLDTNTLLSVMDHCHRSRHLCERHCGG